MITIILPAWQAYTWMVIGIIYSVKTCFEIYSKLLGVKD
jgi:hypothetical protein